MIPAVVGVPIKPFGVAKARLAPVLDSATRSRLGIAIAARTATMLAASGAVPQIVTSDTGVAAWAGNKGWGVIEEPPGGGLDAAASLVVAAAGLHSWAIVHADLPTVTAVDFTEVWRRLGPGGALAPSRDGGTSLIAGRGPFTFAYGINSFHRHRKRMPQSVVVTRPGLALDLDTVDDLELALERPEGDWLGAVVGSPMPRRRQLAPRSSLTP